MGARYYDPISARFTSRDPLGDDVNDYIYCGDNPVENADPSGMDWVNVAADFSAGWGDTLTFGLTGRVRMWLGANGGDAVRQNGAYLAGSGMGIANDALMGKGLADAAKKGLGKVAAKVLPKAVEAGEEASRGFHSCSAAKRALGVAGKGSEWHHVVEARNAERLGAEAVHNSGNLMKLPISLHRKVSAFYSSKAAWLTGSKALTVREWLGRKSFNEQYRYGIKILEYICTGRWPAR